MNPLRTLKSLRDLASLAEMLGLATKADVNALKVDVNALKVDVNALKVDVNALKVDVNALKSDIGARFDQMEKNLLREIGQALNTAIEIFVGHLSAFDDKYKDLPARVTRLENLATR